MHGLEVWRMIRNLKKIGMSNMEIAGQLSLFRNTVSRMLRKTRIKEKNHRLHNSDA